MIVDIAFAVVPTILGLGAAGLIGSSAIRTAKDVMDSISMLKNLGPMILFGGMTAGKLNTLRKEYGGRWAQSDSKVKQGFSFILTPIQFTNSKLKKKQDAQNKQEEQGGGGSGGNPPPPPDIKSSEKKEERPKPTGITTYSPISILNPFKKEE
jgi:hypothetical protein